MQHEGQACYVGLRKAAELHGATHRAVVEVQVVSMKRLPSTRVGRNRIAFYFRKNNQAVTAGIEDRKTDTGTMKISAAAPTTLDLLRYPHASGEIDNVATIPSDLGRTIDPGQLASFSEFTERPVLRRLGQLLEHFGHDGATRPMLESFWTRGSLPWAELDRQEIRDPESAPEPRLHDPRWHIIVRRLPQRDA